MRPATHQITLRFTEWHCGHQCRRPEDIPVSEPEQALLILRAISHAISLPGHARAVLLRHDMAIACRIADDHVRVGRANELAIPPTENWDVRPVVICCTQAQAEALQSEALVDAVAALYGDIDLWDGCGDVDAGQFVATTLSVAQVEAMATPVATHEAQRHQPFELPPIFWRADKVLSTLRQWAAEMAGDVPKAGAKKSGGHGHG